MGKHEDKQTDNLQFPFRSNKTQTNKKTSRFAGIYSIQALYCMVLIID